MTHTHAIKRRVTLVSSIIWLTMSLNAFADVVYETATLGPTGQPTEGFALDGGQWAGARFNINSPVVITGVGGHLTTLRGTLFASIVSLPSASSFPAFAPTDIESHSLASTTFDNGAPSNDFVTPMSGTLVPGHYAIIFGGGEQPTLGQPFGATGAGRAPTSNSLLPGASLFFAVGDNSWGNVVDTQNQQWRFVIEGFVVPECSSLSLLLIAFVGQFFIFRPFAS